MIRTQPSDGEILNFLLRLIRGPVAAYTDAEVDADAKYLDGEAPLLCSAAVKQQENLLAMDGPNGADAARVLIANTGKVDIAQVVKKLCRDEKTSPACS